MKFSIQTQALAIATACLLLTACNDDIPSNTASEPVTPPKVDSISLSAQDPNFDGWDNFYSKDDINFSIDSFILMDTLDGELYIKHYVPTDSFFRAFENLLVYNHDSTKFIDAYSSTWIVEVGKDGKQYAREGEIDQEVAVVDTVNNTRTRILFGGPSCVVQKAFWYNENIVAVMGLLAEYADEYYTPTVWFVNIHNGITIPYQYHTSVSIITADNYTENYLKSRGIKMAY